MTVGVELRFTASFQGLKPGDGRLATFYLMDTGLNRNNWRVTREALVGALETLPGKPLGCIPGYRVNHVHRPQVVGRWLGAEEVDGHAIATAEITDDEVWEREIERIYRLKGTPTIKGSEYRHIDEEKRYPE